MDGRDVLERMIAIELAHRKDNDAEALTLGLLDLQDLLRDRRNVGLCNLQFDEARIRYNGLLHHTKHYVKEGQLTRID